MLELNARQRKVNFATPEITEQYQKEFNIKPQYSNNNNRIDHVNTT